MRYTCHCPRVCLRPWSSSTCRSPLIRSTMTHSSPVCQLGLASLVVSLSGSQHISWIIFNLGSVISECFKLNFWVPEGTVLGLLLLSLYTSPLSKVITKLKDVKYQFYVHDSQLFVRLSPGNCANSFHQLKACLDDNHICMFENKLKLNPGKTEFIVSGCMDKYKWLKDSFPVNILGNYLSPKDVHRNLGVLFHSKFSFTNHVNSVIKSCFANLQDLHHIQRIRIG